MRDQISLLPKLLFGSVLLWGVSGPAVAKKPFHLFEISDGPPAETFVIALSDPKKVQIARSILAGEITDRVHLVGKIVKSRAPYNPKWSFHLNPNSITFETFAPTVCGRMMNTSDIESNLDLVGKPGSPLALGSWCPLGSRVAAGLPMQH